MMHLGFPRAAAVAIAAISFSLCLCCRASGDDEKPPQAHNDAGKPAAHALFARDNLIAWCIVPFDAMKRGPEERAAMLERIGVKRLAYDYRAEHVPTFDAEMEALKRHGIRLDAWWFPTTLNDEAKQILDVLKRHEIETQLWVTGGGGPSANADEQRQRVATEAARIRPIAEAAAKIGCQVALYNHGGWFGEPENQLAIIEKLDLPNVGIVYNLHHGHDHIERLPELLRKMRPHLSALNLNGMSRGGDRDGRKILPLGAGELDLALLRVIRDSGYRGPIGILNHTDHDAEARLLDNLDGLDWLVAQLDGKPAGAHPKYRTFDLPAASTDEPLAEGKFGGALNARGTFAIAQHRDEYGLPPISAECWAKLDGKAGFNILVANNLKESADHWELYTYAGAGDLSVYVPGYEPAEIRSGVDVTDGKWHFVGMAFDGRRVRMFVDGKQVKDAAVTRRKGATKTGQLGGLAIGAYPPHSIRCDGLVDDVRVSRGVRKLDAVPDKPLEADEHTIGIWRLDEIRNGAFADASKLANAAAIGGPFVVRDAEKTPDKLGRIAPPRVLDDRFAISLFAADPDIVTPVGAVIDARGRLLVLENHTHFPPKGYSLHTSDRIRAYEDTDNDGRADRITTFYDGLRHGLNLTLDRDGSILVATRSELRRLTDADTDGVAERSDTLLRLETKCEYPHNGLFSCAVDYNGDLLVSMGENLGEPYRLVGSDGKTISGGGEGGNVFRCHSDGSGVEKIATGFWNPVQIQFDAFGRLFAVDNDPDSRPPCRLLHVVDGGDYGFRYRNGRKGLHPFTAWNGELPGTLPMVSGTGEAPSGLLPCESGLFPDDYRGAILTTSWGDHRVEVFRPKPRGASFVAEVQPLLVGGEEFRPVAIVAAHDDSLYITDWVDKSYELHGRGRIWRVARAQVSSRPRQLSDFNSADDALRCNDERLRNMAARVLATHADGQQALRIAALDAVSDRTQTAAIQALAAVNRLDDELVKQLRSDSSAVRQLVARVAPYSAAYLAEVAGQDTSAEVRAAAVRRIRLDAATLGDASWKVVLKLAASDDPFEQTAARQSLRAAPKSLGGLEIAKLPNARQQVSVLLAQRAAGVEHSPQVFRELLKSTDRDVLFVLIQWIGETRLVELRKDVEALLERPDATSEIAAAAMAALALLDGQRPEEADQTGSHFYMAKLLAAPTSSPLIRARALRGLPSDYESLRGDRFRELLSGSDDRLRLEAIRSLRESPHPDRAALLTKLAGDETEKLQLRAEAAMGLSPSDEPQRALLWKLATDRDDAKASLRREALRTLRGAALDDGMRAKLTEMADEGGEVAAQVAHIVNPQSPDAEISQVRPDKQNVDAWLKLLEGPADPQAGERVFFHAKSVGCYRCHRYDGRGAEVGPDLTMIGRSAERRRIVESILQPAKDIAPLFFSWQIETEDGQPLVGMLVDERVGGDQTYVDANGKRTTFHVGDIAVRRAVRTSIMPDNVVDGLTIQELRDVLAFLTQAATP